MKILIDTKYIKVGIDLKSWGMPICIDWRHNNITRPYYIGILCVHVELGKNPYEGVKRKDERTEKHLTKRRRHTRQLIKKYGGKKNKRA